MLLFWLEKRVLLELSYSSVVVVVVVVAVIVVVVVVVGVAFYQAESEELVAVALVTILMAKMLKLVWAKFSLISNPKRPSEMPWNLYRP